MLYERGENIQQKKPGVSRVSKQSVHSEPTCRQSGLLVASSRKQLGIVNLKGTFWEAVVRIEWEGGLLAETTALEMAGNQKHLFGKTMPLGSWT